MNPQKFRARTRTFALRIIRLSESLPNTPTAHAIRNQLLRSGTSVGANYRAACRAKSRRDFIAKLGIVEEEADETSYWIELLIDTGLINRGRVVDLLQEADEILAMVVSSIRTAKNLQADSKSAIRNQQSAIL